ncbi:MAG: alpha-mannosidase [Verrucomicrobia bacterium]|jgi:mannosylglycerate hydrolase|nr:alpha-mannosidase [Verrucomicrobiota bacterium]
MNKTKTAYIVPHTHWDREWRYPIWKNRVLLVEFMEELLDTLDSDPDYRSFVLDGQVAPIEDYLEVAPHDRERVTEHIRDGRIEIGPWYTLPDLYPVDGECLVRNLLTGTRIAAQYGEPMMVGYNSFGWGQTAQFPQIYAGFGIDFIVCAKRVSKERAPESEFMWEAPDGTRVLTTRLGDHARANFYFHAYLYAKYGVNCMSGEFRYDAAASGIAMHDARTERAEDDFFMIEPKMEHDAERLKKGADDAWAATDETVVKDHRLFMNGTDFSTSHPNMSRMIKDLNEQSPDTEFVHERLETYVAKMHEQIDPASLRVIEGELRDGPSCDCSGNALASRAYLKLLNRQAQNVILRKTEPLAAALSLLSTASSSPLRRTGASPVFSYPRGLMDTAWKHLLQSHPHDSINGVTQDKTANDVEYRLNQALEIGSVVYDKAVSEVLKQIDLSMCGEDEQVLVVFNPLPRPRREIVEACVCTPGEQGAWSLSACDADGNALAVQEISRSEKTFPVHDCQARPWPYKADRHLLRVDAGEIPAGGYKVIRFAPKSSFQRDHHYWLEMRRSTSETLSPADNVLENEHLRVEVAGNGTLSLTDKASDKTYEGLHYFEDGGDVGNYWAFYPPYNDQVFNTLSSHPRIWLEENGPLSATIGIEHRLELPAFAHEPECGVRGESRRSSETKELVIMSRVTLKKRAKRVDVKTEVDNTICNHRLRVAFPTGIKAENACSSGHFTVDERPRVPVKDANGEYWPEMQTLPTQHFVDLSADGQGLALLHTGMTEYEACDDENATLRMTLFRAMGNMIVTWWEAVGIFPDQSGSQLQRKMTFDYALYPHAGDWAEGEVYAEAEALNVPIAPFQITSNAQAGTLPPETSFYSVEPSNLIVSAFKQSQDRDSCIMRLFNPTGEAIKGTIRLGAAVNAAYLTDLNETRLSDLALMDGGTVSVEAAPGKIMTVELER